MLIFKSVNSFNTFCHVRMHKTWNGKIHNEYVYEKINVSKETKQMEVNKNNAAELEIKNILNHIETLDKKYPEIRIMDKTVKAFVNKSEKCVRVYTYEIQKLCEKYGIDLEDIKANKSPYVLAYLNTNILTFLSEMSIRKKNGKVLTSAESLKDNAYKKIYDYIYKYIYICKYDDENYIPHSPINENDYQEENDHQEEKQQQEENKFEQEDNHQQEASSLKPLSIAELLSNATTDLSPFHIELPKQFNTPRSIASRIKNMTARFLKDTSELIQKSFKFSVELQTLISQNQKITHEEVDRQIGEISDLSKTATEVIICAVDLLQKLIPENPQELISQIETLLQKIQEMKLQLESIPEKIEESIPEEIEESISQIETLLQKIQEMKLQLESIPEEIEKNKKIIAEEIEKNKKIISEEIEKIEKKIAQVQPLNELIPRIPPQIQEKYWMPRFICEDFQHLNQKDIEYNLSLIQQYNGISTIIQDIMIQIQDINDLIPQLKELKDLMPQLKDLESQIQFQQEPVSYERSWGNHQKRKN